MGHDMLNSTGFKCAYGVHTGKHTCSTYGLRAVQKAGAVRGLMLILRQFDRCSAAAAVLRASKTCDAAPSVKQAPPRGLGPYRYQAGFVDCACGAADCGALDCGAVDCAHCGVADCASAAAPDCLSASCQLLSCGPDPVCKGCGDEGGQARIDARAAARKARAGVSNDDSPADTDGDDC